MSLDVVTFGEAMMMLVAEQPGPLEQAQSFIKRTAGAETNVAIGLARLGLRVGWVSRLGTDSMGRFLLAALRDEGIDCSHVVCDTGQRTGMLFKGRVAGGGDPEVEYHRRGTAASTIGPDSIDVDWLTGARHLHASGVFPALSDNCRETARRSMLLMRQAGRTVSFDPNLRPSLWSDTERMREAITALAALADWVLPGIEEGRLLTGHDGPEDIARFYRAQGASRVIVKLGPAGAYYDTAEGCGHVAGFPVAQVLDTVGAGDGFAVGVISALLQGQDLPAAVRRGAWIGARAVQVIGDTEGLPSTQQLAGAGL